MSHQHPNAAHEGSCVTGVTVTPRAMAIYRMSRSRIGLHKWRYNHDTRPWIPVPALLGTGDVNTF